MLPVLLGLKSQCHDVCSPHCSPDMYYDTSWENLFRNQDTLSWLIIFFILITCMFDEVVILKGEITCWSLTDSSVSLSITDRKGQEDRNLPHFRPEALDSIRMEDLIKEYLTSKDNVCDC